MARRSKSFALRELQVAAKLKFCTPLIVLRGAPLYRCPFFCNAEAFGRRHCTPVLQILADSDSLTPIRVSRKQPCSPLPSYTPSPVPFIVSSQICAERSAKLQYCRQCSRSIALRSFHKILNTYIDTLCSQGSSWLTRRALQKPCPAVLSHHHFNKMLFAIPMRLDQLPIDFFAIHFDRRHA